MPRLLFTPGKDPVPIVQEDGWAPGLVWTGAENLAPTGIRSPDRPAHSQSLYRLRYLAPHKIQGKIIYDYMQCNICCVVFKYGSMFVATVNKYQSQSTMKNCKNLFEIIQSSV